MTGSIAGKSSMVLDKFDLDLDLEKGTESTGLRGEVSERSPIFSSAAGANLVRNTPLAVMEPTLL